MNNDIELQELNSKMLDLELKTEGLKEVLASDKARKKGNKA